MHFRGPSQRFAVHCAPPGHKTAGAHRLVHSRDRFAPTLASETASLVPDAGCRTH